MEQKKILSPDNTTTINTALIKNRDIHILYKYSEVYKPTAIDFSDNDSLNSFDLDYIFNSEEYQNEIDRKKSIASVFLLKLYLHHLKNYNQGYDLLSMRKGEAKYLINYYLISNDQDTTAEFINTALPYQLLNIKNNEDGEIHNLIKQIKIESKRIMMME